MITKSIPVIPAKAGTHLLPSRTEAVSEMVSRHRGNDELWFSYSAGKCDKRPVSCAFPSIDHHFRGPIGGKRFLFQNPVNMINFVSTSRPGLLVA
jgi:hypothetical protein